MQNPVQKNKKMLFLRNGRQKQLDAEEGTGYIERKTGADPKQRHRIQGGTPVNRPDYKTAAMQLQSLIEDNEYEITALSNAAAMIWELLDEINWAGFYLMRDGMLILGPFQGKVACTRIPVGKGVCGTAVEQDCVQLVKNVHEFPGHIACDSASNSEIVLPLHRNGAVYGVLDIDSPVLARFTEEDRQGLGMLAEVLEQNLKNMK